MNKFEIGDKVICIKSTFNRNGKFLVEEGKSYTVSKLSKTSINNFIGLYEIDSNSLTINENRFELNVKLQRKTKMDKLDNI